MSVVCIIHMLAKWSHCVLFISSGNYVFKVITMKRVHSFQQMIEGISDPKETELNFSPLGTGRGEFSEGQQAFQKLCDYTNMASICCSSSALRALLKNCHIHSMLLPVNYCLYFLWLDLNIWNCCFLTIFTPKNLNANSSTQYIKPRAGIWTLLRSEMEVYLHYSFFFFFLLPIALFLNAFVALPLFLRTIKPNICFVVESQPALWGKESNNGLFRTRP